MHIFWYILNRKYAPLSTALQNCMHPVAFYPPTSVCTRVRVQEESVREMTFALKIILSTVDHLLQNQQIELAGKTPKRLKSRKVFS